MNLPKKIAEELTILVCEATEEVLAYYGGKLDDPVTKWEIYLDLHQNSRLIYRDRVLVGKVASEFMMSPETNEYKFVVTKHLLESR